jgi:hypothetical protein
MAVRLASILAFALLAGLFLGCGGDRRRAETESGEAPTRSNSVPASEATHSGPVRVTKVTDPTRRHYIARVDAVCGKLDTERATQEEKVGSAHGAVDAAKAYDDTIALGWRELKRIESITPPPGDAVLLKANVFDSVRGQLKLRARISAALAETDLRGLRALRAELDNSTRALTGFARGYGFEVCGEA